MLRRAVGSRLLVAPSRRAFSSVSTARTGPRGLGLRRALATEAQAPAEDNHQLLRIIAGLTGIVLLQRWVLPAPKPATPHPPAPKPKPAPVIAAGTPAEPVPAAAEPVAAVIIAAAKPVTPSTTVPLSVAATTPPISEPMLPPASKDFGSAGMWRVYEDGGTLYAVSQLVNHVPVELTPRRVTVGTVLLGKGELLAELDGYGPGAPQLFRITLPDPELPTDQPPTVAPDAMSPAGVATPAGSVLSWILTAEPLAVRGALVDSGSEGVSLALREAQPARVGSPAWLRTCQRLGLPEPPVDPTAPPLFSDWKCVAQWEAGQVRVRCSDQ